MVGSRLQLDDRIFERVQPLVLVVDDSADDRFLLNHKLVLAGFSVKEAANGLEGLESALRLLPEIVITDTNMVSLHGPYFVQNLLEQYSTKHPLGKSPLVIGCSDQHYLTEGQFKDLTKDSKDVKTIEDIYSKILNVRFKDKNSIFSYITAGLRAEFIKHKSEQNQKQIILLVEDDTFYSSYLTNLLKQSSYHVITAKDSKEGLTKAKAIHNYGRRYTMITDTDLEEELAGLHLVNQVKLDYSVTGNPLLIGMSGTSRQFIPKDYGLGVHFPLIDGEIELGEAYRCLGAARFVPKKSKHCSLTGNETGIDDYISRRLDHDLTLHSMGHNLLTMKTSESGMFRLD